MKKILAIAAVAALTAGVSAYAANPFSDVSTSDWAYQAVSDLSDQGIVEGYPDGTFKGQQNMTRYELAQIIARLMAKEDQLNAEQKATVDKLAAQYADELANLGVRVANVEKKLGNVSFTGTAQFSYEKDFEFTPEKTKYKAKKANSEELEDKDGYNLKTKFSDKYEGNMKLNAKAKVNDQVTVMGRLKAGLNFQKTEKATEVKMDKLHVVYTPTKNFSIDAGRTGVTLGGGAWYDDNFTGVVAKASFDRVNLSAGYGRFTGVGLKFIGFNDKSEWKKPEVNVDAPFWFVKGDATIAEKINVGAFYLSSVDKLAMHEIVKDKKITIEKATKADIDDKKAQKASFWGVNAEVEVANGLKLGGEYVWNRTDLGKDINAYRTFKSFGLTYGELDTDKVGSFEVAARYYDKDRCSYYGGSGANYADYLGYCIGTKLWEVSADVAVMPAMDLKVYYTFNVKVKDEIEGIHEVKVDNVFGLKLNYAF